MVEMEIYTNLKTQDEQILGSQKIYGKTQFTNYEFLNIFTVNTHG